MKFFPIALPRLARSLLLKKNLNLYFSLLFILGSLLPLKAFGRAGSGNNYDSSRSGSSSNSSSSSSSRPSSSSESSNSITSRSSEKAKSSTSSGESTVYFKEGFIFMLAALAIAGVILFLSNLKSNNSGAGEALSSRIDFNRMRELKKSEKDMLTRVKKPNVQDLIKKNDPDFDSQKFLKRAENGFLALQKSWGEGNLNSINSFVSDGVLERFKIQLDELKKKGLKNALSDIQIGKRTLRSHFEDGLYESITVEFSVTGLEKTWKQIAEQQVEVSSQQSKFNEYWTFTRQKSAIKQNISGLLEGVCPNCNASLAMNQNATCASCNATIKNGKFDWVLTEITQQNAENLKSDTTWADPLRARDPEFSIQMLEDRASVVFWRLISARALRQPTLLKSVLDKNHLDHFMNASQYENVGVGSIEANRHESLPNDGIDIVTVRVTWTGTQVSQKSSQTKTSNLKLMRRISGSSLISQAYGSDHCSGCGQL